MVLERYRLRDTNAVTPTDLDNYLSDEAIFFRFFRPFMRPYTSIDRLSESVTIAQESFVYAMELDEWKSPPRTVGRRAPRQRDDDARTNAAAAERDPASYLALGVCAAENRCDNCRRASRRRKDSMSTTFRPYQPVEQRCRAA